MDRFTRIVLGYHGCEPAFAESLIRGDVAVKDWKPSANVYDWLGQGIYFWEYAPERALAWGGKGGVVGAVIQLGLCLDFTDIRYTTLLAAEYEAIKNKHEQQGLTLPENRGGKRDLDSFIVNSLVNFIDKGQVLTFQTVRGPFLEGEPAFPGSAILRESHIQIAVRDSACILGVFRPT
jgi:hypothetical protein